MKFKVTVEGRAFEVEVGDLQARPVVAFVDGERFEVWPEGDMPQPGVTVVPVTAPAAARPWPASPPVKASADGAAAVTAPIPGVIVSVAVQPGAEVTVGQELCVLEAMKMKNAIRASRAGRVGAVYVASGQQVKYRDKLIEYAD